ncbi:MAG: DUF3147 family protein [Bacteroidetes bacterium]|nr:DUF3147 family protein [Bacteroidota bacterium]
MWYYIVKVAITTTLIGAILASIPLVFVLAAIWLFVETKDVEKVSVLSSQVFWMVLPSLALFILLPILLRSGMNFYGSMGISLAVTAVCYGIMVVLLRIFNIYL